MATKTVRPKMSVENRAKQFMPFAALRGLAEALAQKEKIIVDRIELTEDMAAELDWSMRGLEAGMIVAVVYFCKGEYLKKTGIVSMIDKVSRVLHIVEMKIGFEELLKLEREN